jgi:hypothetical protein
MFNRNSRLILFLTAGFLLMLSSCARRAPLASLDPTQYPYPFQNKLEHQIGDTLIATVSYEVSKPGLTLFSMHDDENTAVEAGVHFIRKYGGRLIQLKHTGERLVQFKLDSRSYTFDPNRMFTDKGASDSLKRYGESSPQAIEEVRKFADDVLEKHGIDQLDLIITLHNNTEKNYSAEQYLPGQEYESDARNVFILPGSDTDDFFFVTDETIYSAITSSGYNAVLQNNETATDDGSLSVLAARIGIPYVNIEAQHGHLAEQFKMLEELSRILGSQ